MADIDDEVKKLVQEIEKEFGESKTIETAQESLERAADLLCSKNGSKAQIFLRRAIGILEAHFEHLKHHPEYQSIVEEAAGMEIYIGKGLFLLVELEKLKLGQNLSSGEIHAVILRASEKANRGALRVGSILEFGKVYWVKHALKGHASAFRGGPWLLRKQLRFVTQGRRILKCRDAAIDWF